MPQHDHPFPANQAPVPVSATQTPRVPKGSGPDGGRWTTADVADTPAADVGGDPRRWGSLADLTKRAAKLGIRPAGNGLLDGAGVKALAASEARESVGVTAADMEDASAVKAAAGTNRAQAMLRNRSGRGGGLPSDAETERCILAAITTSAA